MMMALTVVLGVAGCMAAGDGLTTGGSALRGAMAGGGAVTSRAPMAPAPAGADSCSGCHVASGRLTSMPRLVGLDRQVIVDAMQAYRSGTRPATVMDRIAKGFTDDEIQAIATWYAAQTQGK